MERITITDLADKIANEHDAYAFLEGLRWGDTPVCPHCERDDRCHYLKPANGVSRKTRTGAASQRRVWFCGACRKQFSVLTGTIFHGSKISVHKWLFVFFEMCSSKKGVSAREIERKYGLTPKSAWFMLHRIRESMKRDPFASLLSGNITADETFIGGSDRNRHKAVRHPGITPTSTPTPGHPRDAVPRRQEPQDRRTHAGRPADGRGPVTGRPRRDRGESPQEVIADQVVLGATVPHTDQWLQRAQR